MMEKSIELVLTLMPILIPIVGLLLSLVAG